MIFHWLKLYGKAGRGATKVATETVDDVFTRAQTASPQVFAASSNHDSARKAKFEHICPWLALKLAQADAATTRKTLEVMVDRIDIGLREGGVSDVRVGPEVRKYAAALNGRMQRYIPLMQEENWQELAVALKEHGVNANLAETLKAQAPKKAA